MNGSNKAYAPGGRSRNIFIRKNSTTIEYPTAGHFLQEEKPAEIIEEMKHFISHNNPQKKANDINE